MAVQGAKNTSPSMSSDFSDDSGSQSEPMASTSKSGNLSLASPDTQPSSLVRHNQPKFPVRLGISWNKGEKLEAMDYSRTWYPSKIVDIDEASKYVLIHFEGWNQRYDEWMPMDSNKLRPITRHSERKEKTVSKRRRIHPHPIYRPGEKVLAKWIDCKKYPAKIVRLKDDGLYEVVFFDGVTRLIQPMNIQPLPEGMAKEAQKSAPPESPQIPRPKLSFKDIKVTLPESVKRVKERLEKSKQQKCKLNSDMTNTMDSCVVSISRLNEGTQQPINIQDSRPKSRSFSFSGSRQLSHESLEDDDVYIVSEVHSNTLKIKRLHPFSGEKSHDETAVSSHDQEVKAEKVLLPSIPASNESTQTKPAAEANRVISSASSAPAKPMGRALDLAGTPASSGVRQFSLKRRRRRRRTNSAPFFTCKTKKIIPKLRDDGMTSSSNRIRRRRRPKLGFLDRAKSLDGACSEIGPFPKPSFAMEPFVPSKAFIVAEDHNPFKCPQQGCSKAFRKENLLAYHIKYYHTDMELSATQSMLSGDDSTAGVTSPLLPPSSVQSPVSRKRRKKTNSICSTDSDVSISSRGRPGKRHRHDSEITVTAVGSPDALGRDLWADVKHSRLSQDSATEESIAVDTEDEETEADVVNCTCGLRETNGLMIQCDVCMCWQHFACVDVDNTGVPPVNYVCQICENTPGIRHSCRYIADMGWERRGELPLFPFAPETPRVKHLRYVASECNDMTAALLTIKSALHSTRRQLKISKEDADPEFQLWQTDWDNWTKPEEDLMLTPRSGDPDPSPTPSTFLFPHAAHSNHTATAPETFAVSSVTRQSDSSSRTFAPISQNFAASDRTDSMRTSYRANVSSTPVTSFSSSSQQGSLVSHPPLSHPWTHTSATLPPANILTPAQTSVTPNNLSAHPGNLLPSQVNALTTSHADTDNRAQIFNSCQSGDRNEHGGSFDVAKPKENGQGSGTLKWDVHDSSQWPKHSDPVSPTNAAHTSAASDLQAIKSDTDTAEESLDPYRNCEQNLLVHVNRIQSDIEKQLEFIEQQISELENSELNNAQVQLTEDNVLNDVPALKKSLGRLCRNLTRVQKFCLQ